MGPIHEVKSFNEIPPGDLNYMFTVPSGAFIEYQNGERYFIPVKNPNSFTNAQVFCLLSIASLVSALLGWVSR